MRFKAIQIFLYCAFVVILARLWFWQMLQHDQLTARAEDQRVSTKTIQAPRGSVLFSDGSVLASSQEIYTIFAQPKIIDNKLQVARQLAEFFWQEKADKTKPIDEATRVLEIKKIEDGLYDKISKDLFWVNLDYRLNLDQKNRLEKLKITGIGFDSKLSRFYPEGSSSAHLLGFVSADAYGADTGYFGLEGYYDGELKGKTGVLKQDQDAMGLPILIGLYQVREAKPGKTLILNVDRTIQYIVEEKLKKGLAKYGAKGASAIVMDPETGAILAMASYPSYDPAAPIDSPPENYRNPITADFYEPGSTFKVLVMAAGINEKLVRPDTICNVCSAPLQISGFTIRTWNNQYMTNPTMTDTIIHSDNTGMVFVGNKLGSQKLHDYLDKFGIGQLTGIDLQDEHSPDLRPFDQWKEIDLATTSFGQGISTTALQVVRAVGSIANGGKLMEPHVVKEIKDKDKDYLVQPRVVSQPISPETATLVKEMMIRAVDEGEAKFAKTKGFRVAGKTGTAQIPVAGHYDANKTIASFVGFAPADKPKFVMLVRYDEPKSSIYGAETAAPTFFDIAKELFTYFGIAPTEDE